MSLLYYTIFIKAVRRIMFFLLYEIKATAILVGVYEINEVCV